MAKRFNITGLCIPDKHYMVDISNKLREIGEMIDRGDYFTINRARQFGKTTTLNMIRQMLGEHYMVMSLSFEGDGDAPYQSEETFSQYFNELLVDELNYATQKEKLSDWNPQSISSMKELSSIIEEMCEKAGTPILLLIDEVDKSSDNQLFLSFIGMLRDKYLDRPKKGINSTFHNVVLAGVYDVKNLKLKLRPDEERKYNSPWNIAADFNVDMTFNPQEISTMLNDYENDMHTGMDIMRISEEIYKFTSGYPFLVSKLCKVIDEELDRNWTVEGVQLAVARTVKCECTLFDDIAKNLEMYPDFKQFIYSVVMLDADVAFESNNVTMKLAKLFSIIKPSEDRRVVIHNQIFEQVLYNYFIAEEQLKNLTMNRYKSKFVFNGKLNFERVIERFSDLMHEEYRTADQQFLERQGRLLFLCFLKPIINGTGFYYVEPQTRENSRMDLIVTFGGEEFVIELKIWRGTKYEERGRDQLSEYLAVRGLDEGYLVTFDFSKDKPAPSEPEWIEHNGKRIYEAIV